MTSWVETIRFHLGLSQDAALIRAHDLLEEVGIEPAELSFPRMNSLAA